MMDNEKTDRIKAIEVAISNEMRERKFYLTHAARSKNPLGRMMFQQIADDELEHYNRLKEMEEKWKETYPDTIIATIKGTNLRKTLKGLLAQIETLPQTDQNELQAIRTAIAFETKGVQYYHFLRDAVFDPKEKAFFGLLADMEQEHLDILKQTEAYLLNPTEWQVDV
jgi:hypothetical protein